jgi:hypothetical protein
VQRSFRLQKIHPLCALALAGLTALNACSRRVTSAPRDNPLTLNEAAERYVQLALALGERDPDSLDFSTAPGAEIAAVHASYPALDEIGRDVASLQVQLRGLHLTPADQPRAEFLDRQLRAMQERVAMLRGERLPFDREAQVLFDTTRLPDTHAAARQALRTHIGRMLPPATKTGEDEAGRLAAYDARFIIPPARLLPVFHAALALCRQQTVKHIALPKGESVEVNLVRQQPWAAFSRYMGHAHSVISLNVDLPMTVDDALELACHEGYPGHHVFNTLRDTSLAQGRHWPEAEVQLTFSPQSYISEAAAAYAPEMAFTDAERAQVERDVLFPMAGLPSKEAERDVAINSLVRRLDSAEPAIARSYVDGDLEFVRAEQALAREALMANAEGLLLYLNEYRSYMLAYTDGPRRLAAELDAKAGAKPDARWRLYAVWMQEMKYRFDTQPPSR